MKLRYLIPLLLSASTTFAQYGRMDFSLQSAQGQAVAGATVNVYAQPSCGAPFSGPATIYPSATGGTPLTQPLSTDGFGSAFAYAPTGCYTVVYFSPFTGTRTFVDQVPASPNSSAFYVNGVLVASPNAQAASPAAPSGHTNCTWQSSGSFVSCYVPNAGGITALTGDGTATGPGSAAFTLATVNSNVGTCGDATHVGQVTLNAKGLTTACTPVAITGGGGGGVPANVIFASQGNGSVAGCTLNTNLLTGGGTDATTCLQAQLDWLGSNGGGTFILNGPALISNATYGATNSVDGNVQTTALQTHSNVTILVTAGGGAFLAASSNCTMLGNNTEGDPTTSAYQTNMKVIGGFWNGNNANQSQFEAGNSNNAWNYGFWFGGFNGLETNGVTLRNVATFNFFLSNGENFAMNNDTETETTTVPGLSTNQDGIHLDGTLTNGSINNFVDNGGDDDPIAINTDEGVVSYNAATAAHYQRFPHSGGAITNIKVDGVTLNGTQNTMRYIGYTTTNGVATVGNVDIRNFTGTSSIAVQNSGLTSCANVRIDNWTPTISGSVTDPNLGACAPTPVRANFNTTYGTGSSGGAWSFLDPGLSGGNAVGFYLGSALGSGEHAGSHFFTDSGSTSSHWQWGFQGNSNTATYYAGGDFSLTGSDCSSAFCLPTSGGIKQATGGSSSSVYATDGSTQALPSGSGNYVNITGSITWTGCTSSSGVCTTTGSVASITAASIPGGYNNLIFVLNGVGSTSLGLTCQFNGDSGSNYASQGSQTNGSNNQAVNTVSQTSIQFCGYVGPLAGSSTLEIPFYAGSSPKIALITAGSFGSISSNTNNYSEAQTGAWSGTAAITQVVLTTNTGTVSTGFKISVYGTN